MAAPSDYQDASIPTCDRCQGCGSWYTYTTYGWGGAIHYGSAGAQRGYCDSCCPTSAPAPTTIRCNSCGSYFSASEESANDPVEPMCEQCALTAAATAATAAAYNAAASQACTTDEDEPDEDEDTRREAELAASRHKLSSLFGQDEDAAARKEVELAASRHHMSIVFASPSPAVPAPVHDSLSRGGSSDTTSAASTLAAVPPSPSSASSSSIEPGATAVRAPAPTHNKKFCTQCRSPVLPVDKFCGQCATEL